MAVGAGGAAVVFAVLLDGVVDCDNANAAVAGTFLLGYGWHGLSPIRFRRRRHGHV